MLQPDFPTYGHILNGLCISAHHNEGAGFCLKVMSNLQEIEVTYLTNACGEDTGYGTLELTESDLNKVAFDQGPGCLLPYIIEIEEKAFVSANLEICHKDSYWYGSDEDFMAEDVAKAYCLASNRYLETKVRNGAIVLPVEEDDPGRFIVRVAIPLEQLHDWEHTQRVLSDIFGELVHVPKDFHLNRQVA